MLDILQTERLVPDQGEDTAGSSDNDVRAVLLQDVLVFLDRQATKEYCCFYGGHVLGETLVLFADLEGQLSCVTHD